MSDPRGPLDEWEGYEGDKAAYKHENSLLRADNATLRDAKEDAEAAAQNLRAQVDMLRNEKRWLCQQADELLAENRRLRSRLAFFVEVV